MCVCFIQFNSCLKQFSRVNCVYYDIILILDFVYFVGQFLVRFFTFSFQIMWFLNSLNLREKTYSRFKRLIN